MRLSDILKKANQNPSLQQQEELPKKEAVATEIPQEKPVSVFKRIENQQPKTTEQKVVQQPAPLPIENNPQNITSAAEESYTESISEAKTILTTKTYPKNIKSIKNIVSLIEQKNESLLVLATKSTPDTYLYSSTVNNTIISVLVGFSMGLNRNMLNNLAYTAFLINFENIKKSSITASLNKVTTADYSALKKHLPQDSDILKDIPAVIENVKVLILNIITESKRTPSDYPVELLKTEEVDLFARIITIACIYEALTHPFVPQDRQIPHEAIKSLINSAGEYMDQDILKALVKSISIYPPGSYVRLNSGEIAKVIGINREQPTRPKVFIMIDPNMNRATQLKVVDLGTTPMLFVKEAIDETKLVINDKKLMIELKAMRWWVKGI